MAAMSHLAASSLLSPFPAVPGWRPFGQGRAEGAAAGPVLQDEGIWGHGGGGKLGLGLCEGFERQRQK